MTKEHPSSPKRWDIYLAKVPFEEKDGRYRVRPVLIYEKRQAFILTFKMTSHAPRSNFPGEYAIRDWSAAGLSKRTTIRLSKPFVFREQDLQRKLGFLQRDDRAAITRIIEKMYPRQQQSREESRAERAARKSREAKKLDPTAWAAARENMGGLEPPTRGLSR